MDGYPLIILVYEVVSGVFEGFKFSLPVNLPPCATLQTTIHWVRAPPFFLGVRPY